MKKNRFYLLAAMATAVFSLSSCIYDDEVATATPNGELSQEEIKITASMAGTEVNTRGGNALQATTVADYTKLGIFAFKSGQTNSLASSTGVVGYAGYKNLQVTGHTSVTGGEKLTTSSTMYFPLDNADVDVWVYGPYDAANNSASISSIPITVQSNQTLDADYLKSDFIYGKATAMYSTDKTASVDLYHALTKVTFNIDELETGNAAQISEIKLVDVFPSATIDMTATINTTPTSGDPYLNNGATNVTTTTGSRGDVVVCDKTNDANIYTDAKTGVSAIIPPLTATELNNATNPSKVSVTIDGVTKTANIYQATGTGALTELKPGLAYTFTLKIKSDEIIVVVVSIVDWVTGSSVNRDLTF